MATETAVLGAGCFWCIDAAFRRVAGVTRVESGYAGGQMENPNYEAVCTGTTGHAEVVSVEFDSDQITFDDVLELFFALHDPTTLNRQGADVGTQYRSAIFPTTAEQEHEAASKIAQLNASGRWADPIVTTIEQADVIYPAEDYHQEYVSHNPANRYCQMVVVPKLQKFFKQHGDRLIP
ncbi:MAG: peptide-methionine (S)-S-oxide reductase MsrA [Pseudomonadota bacterium]